MVLSLKIKQLKELLGEGILTQEEFDEQKNALLKSNIQSDSVQDTESETIEIKMAATDAKTGEPCCPYCGSTKIKSRRGKLGRIAAVSTMGMANMAIPKSAVKCFTCGKLFNRGSLEQR